MKRSLSAILALLCLGGALSACSSQEPEKAPLTAQERTQLYQTAIEEAAGPNANSFVEIVTSPQDDMAEMVLMMLGLEEEDMSAFALAISPVNVQAYGIAAIYPAQGKEDDVLEALNGFIDNQKESFQQYLEEEYETASNTRLETLEDGTILMVMVKDQDTVFDAIRDAVESAA